MSPVKRPVKPAKKAAKKVAKRPVMKKAPAKKVAAKKAATSTAFEYLSLRTGKPVSEKYAKANPTLVQKKRVKVEAKPVPAKKRGVLAKAVDKMKKALSPPSTRAKPAPSVEGPVVRFEDRVMVDGLQSTNSYVVVSRPEGSPNGPQFVAMRLISPSRVRVHAFPHFAAHGIDKPPYSQGTMRSRLGYQTCWVPAAEAKALMTFLSTLGHRLLNAERLEAFLNSSDEAAARSALALN